MIRTFETDAEYLQWCKTNGDGYVLNAHRGLSPVSLMIHRAHCRLITRYQGKTQPGGFVEKQYLKVGSRDAGKLKNWARKERLAHRGKLDGIARECKTCM